MEKGIKQSLELDDGTSDMVIQRNGSNFNAFISVVCLIAGAGTLGMPDSFRRGGWISIFFIFLSGTVAWYTGVLLVQCLYYKPGTRLTDYPSVGEAAFGRKGRITVQIFHYAVMLGVATLFIMLAGKNVHGLAVSHGITMSEKIWITLAGAVILIPYVGFKSMKEVWLMSVFGALTTLVTVIISCRTGLLDLERNVNQTHAVINWAGVPTSLATIGFSFGGTVIYTHVEGTMRQPKKWPLVLGLSLASVSIMYLVMGVVGYYVYGNGVQSPVLDSLPVGGYRDSTYIIITLHLIAAAPLPLTSFSLEMEKYWKIDSDHLPAWKEFIIRVISRLVVVIPLTLIAAFLPYFGDFMSLIGAISNLVVVYITPVVCHLKLFGWRNRSPFTYLAMFVCLLMGFFGGALGAVDAVRSIINNVIRDLS